MNVLVDRLGWVVNPKDFVEIVLDCELAHQLVELSFMSGIWKCAKDE